jgi:hypothetical protein
VGFSRAELAKDNWNVLHYLTPGRFRTKPEKFDWKFYIQTNPDLHAKGIVTEADAKKHWKRGVREGRQGNYQVLKVAKVATTLAFAVKASMFDKLAKSTKSITEGNQMLLLPKLFRLPGRRVNMTNYN